MPIIFPELRTIPVTNDPIPIIGFGSGTKWQWKKKAENPVSKEAPTTTDPELVASLIAALKEGFVHLDTAEIYTTRPDVGAAFHASGLNRDDVFITDKYHARGLSIDGKHRGPYASLQESLKLMGIDYINLFLLHTMEFQKEYPLLECWKEMIKLREEGLVRNIGVSNFDVKHLEAIKNAGLPLPQVLQIEFHPYLQEQSTGIVEYAKANNILLEAYGPLVPLTKARGGPLDALLERLSEKYGKSATQVLLKFAHANGFVTVTTTSKVERMRDILGVFNWELSLEDTKLISETGNSYFFRAFPITLLPDYDEELKANRGISPVSN